MEKKVYRWYVLYGRSNLDSRFHSYDGFASVREKAVAYMREVYRIHGLKPNLFYRELSLTSDFSELVDAILD